MGCDYWIDKVLEIYVKRDDFIYMDIEVECEKGYYHFYHDEDAPDYDESFERYKKNCLTVDFTPILIYENGQFFKPTFEAKYKALVERELKEDAEGCRRFGGDCKTWDG